MTTWSPDLNAVAHPVVAAARHVRTAVLAVVASAATLVLMLSGHDHVSGLRADAPDLTSLSAPVQAVIATQEARGLTCSTTPTRTDVVVVERSGGGVAVLGFAAALDAATDRTGSIRAYCL